jgi:hypothetical protein
MYPCGGYLEAHFVILHKNAHNIGKCAKFKSVLWYCAFKNNKDKDLGYAQSPYKPNFGQKVG